MKILTITLNPAFDVHCMIDNLQLHRENYVTDSVKHAGGKGINISRALSGFGVENTALCVVGHLDGDEFLKALSRDSISYKSVVTEGKIRENITLHSNGKETRISFEGFTLTKDCTQKIYEMIEKEKCDDLLVTFTGRLCKGITNEDAVEFLLKIKGLGARLIVDCNSFTREELFEIRPFLIKPNEQEISQLLGYEIKTEAEALDAARILREGGVENAIVSLGSRGLVFCGGCGELKIDVPKITPLSTIGAGDSMIAGFVAGLSMGREMPDTLRLAAAFGTAACLEEGTNPPTKENIICIEKEIVVNGV